MFYGSLFSGDMDDSALLRMKFHLPLFSQYSNDDRSCWSCLVSARELTFR